MHLYESCLRLSGDGRGLPGEGRGAVLQSRVPIQNARRLDSLFVAWQVVMHAFKPVLLYLRVLKGAATPVLWSRKVL